MAEPDMKKGRSAAARRPPPRVLVRDEAREPLVPAAAVRRAARAALAALDLGGRELSVLVCGAETMRGLNRDWRGKDRPTDVLSFAQGEGVALGDTTLLGDLVLCAPVLLAQAAERAVPPEHELARLVAHGLLHLVGYDHERGAAEARRMRVREDELVAALSAPPRAGRAGAG